MIELEVIDQIGRHCPRAMSVYVLCFGRMDENNSVSFTKDYIVNDLSESYCRFKNDLKSLAREGLLEWHEMGTNLHVILGDNNVGDI